VKLRKNLHQYVDYWSLGKDEKNTPMVQTVPYGLFLPAREDVEHPLRAEEDNLHVREGVCAVRAEEWGSKSHQL
jgi:hypothetical protein